VSIEPSSRTRTFIIADDLTGACDAAVAFSHRGASTEVLLDANHYGIADIQVRAISTETREGPPERAIEIIHGIAQREDLSHYDQIFKKIDSTFRGNTLSEIRAALDVFHDYFAVLAPAYPALGRTSVDGALNIRDITGETSISLRETLLTAGLRPYWIAARQSANQIERHMLQNLQGGNRLVFCDAVTEEDLRSTVDAARATRRRILWIGSAGLAHALAADIPARKPPAEVHPKGATLIFVGSNHPVTQKQVADLQKNSAVNISQSEIPDKVQPETAAIVFRIERSQTTEAEIRSAVEKLALQPVSCLFVTGGDTAMLVCHALGIHSLRLQEEFEPGIPQGVAVGGPFTGCNIILKSGGFGQTGVLSRVAKHFSGEKVATP
jgi:D-threonate/D-erythronate kinase